MTKTDSLTLEEALEYLVRIEFMPVPVAEVMEEMLAKFGVELLIEAIRYLDEKRDDDRDPD